jgi:hypothetical protein
VGIIHNVHSPRNQPAQGINVEQRNSSTEKPPRTGWQLIGQLQLPIDSMPGQSMEDWLIGTLKPFRLPLDLFNKLKISIEEALSQLDVTPDDDYVPAISIYMSDDVRVAYLPKNWGFFKIEKVDTPSNKESLGEHVIEYYLYSER